MGKNFLLKSCLVLALIMAFCIKAASQSTNDIPKEGNMFYMENGKTRTVKAGRQRSPVDIQARHRELF